MGKCTGKKICRLVGFWDLLLTLPFALPAVNVRVLELLSVLHARLSPETPFPVFYDLHVFFVQLFGILAVLWAVVRIIKPSAFLSFCDLTGRFVVAAMMLHYSYKGTSSTILLFSASEIGFGAVQAIVLGKEKLLKRLKKRRLDVSQDDPV